MAHNQAYLLSRFIPFIPDVPDSAIAKPRPRGFWQRVLDAMMESRQRQAEREVARFVELRGGKFTDETDRLISDRLP